MKPPSMAGIRLLSLFSWLPAAYVFFTGTVVTAFLVAYHERLGFHPNVVLGPLTLTVPPITLWVQHRVRKGVARRLGSSPPAPATSVAFPVRMSALPGSSLIQWVTRLPPVRALLRPRLMMDGSGLIVRSLVSVQRIDYSTVADGLATVQGIVLTRTDGSRLLLRTSSSPRHFGCLIASHELGQAVRAKTFALLGYNERILAVILEQADQVALLHASKGGQATV
jgi:hypothetical protein